MKLFGGKKPGRGKARVEPRLVPDARSSRNSKAARQPKPRRRSLLGRLIKYGVLLSLWGVLGLGAVFGYIWLTLSDSGVLTIPERDPGIMILASDGLPLAEQGSFRGDEALLRDLPDYVPQALIAIEDRRFYSHFGVDPMGLVRAIYTNYRNGRLVQGGSTLTQQLAKNLFLSPDRTVKRKLQEVVLAVWLESKFTKDEILQLYLNRVYYGSGATGIEKAAQTYYKKAATDLTLMEAATLAGVLKAPTNYNPIKHPEAAAERARLVVQSMVEVGFISETEARDAIGNPATVKATDYVPSTQYIADWIGEQLPDLVKSYDQSIIVETSIDRNLQSVAERSLRKRLSGEGAKVNVTQGAIIVMDGMGEVKALVGGRSYKRSQYNRVTKAKRQPGSAFKPFLYLAAIERGMTPGSVEVDEPVKIGNWEPENYRQKYMGPVTLKTALALSLNTVAAKLVMEVGPEQVASLAHRLGIVSPLGNDASIALGTSEVTLMELTGAFVPFANNGYPVVPHAIKRISTRDGQVLYQRTGEGFGQAISEFDLGAFNGMMRAVVTDGTGKRAQFAHFDIAGKTGTSQDYRDAWFIGYTADYVAGVWVGNDDNSPTNKVTGGSLPALIWKDVMSVAHAGLSPRPLPGETDGGAEDLYAVTQAEPQPQSQRPEQAPRGGGFLEGLGTLFGGENASKQPGGKDRKKKRSETAFERMNRVKDNK